MNLKQAAKNLLSINRTMRFNLLGDKPLDISGGWDKAISDMEKALAKEPDAEEFLKEKGIAVDMNLNTCTKKPPKIKLTDLLNEYRNL